MIDDIFIYMIAFAAISFLWYLLDITTRTKDDDE